jgi:hypothetical protein
MQAAPVYMREVSDQTIRQRFLLAKLQKSGRIVLNMDGYELNWNVKYRRHPVIPYGDDNTLDYSRQNLFKQATLDWRGYKTTDKVTYKETLMVKNSSVIVNRVAEMITAMAESLTTEIGREVYTDGNATGNQDRLCGTGTFTGAGTVTSNDLIAIPNDIYAGLATNLGSEGSWTTDLTTKPNAALGTDWPYGSGSEEYDFWSPKLVNASSTNWGTSSATWAANCEYVLRATKEWLTVGGGIANQPSIALLNSQWFVDFKNKLSSKQRYVAEHQEAQELGFRDVLSFDGMAVQSDYDVPSQKAYVFNIEQMALLSLEDELIHARDPVPDPHRDSTLFQCGIFGNLMFNPKYFAEIALRA